MKKIFLIPFIVFSILNLFYFKANAYESSFCDSLSDDLDKKICLQSIEYANYECNNPSSLGKKYTKDGKEYSCSVSKIALTYLGKETLDSYFSTNVCKKDYKTLLKEKRTSSHLKDYKYNFDKFYKDVWYYTNCFNNSNKDFVNKHTIFSRLIGKALWLEESKDLTDNKYLNNKLLLKYYIDNYEYNNTEWLKKSHLVYLPTSSDSEFKKLVKISDYFYKYLKNIYKKDYKSLSKSSVNLMVNNLPKDKNINKELLNNYLSNIIENEYKNSFELSSLIWKANVFNSSLILMDLSDDLSWYTNKKFFESYNAINNRDVYTNYTSLWEPKIKSSIIASYFTLKYNWFNNEEIKKYLVKLSFIILEKQLK